MGPLDVGRAGADEPAHRTPLAVAFYKKWRATGMTLDALAARAELSVSTVWAYLNGTRGSGGQSRQQPTITAIAKALDIDPEQALKLAGQAPRAGVVDAIRADAGLSRRDKEMLISIYEQRRR